MKFKNLFLSCEKMVILTYLYSSETHKLEMTVETEVMILNRRVNIKQNCEVC